MAYSDFTLETAIAKLGLELRDRPGLFRDIPPRSPSDMLQGILAENTPLALASNTEKARSELIIAPILVELRRQCDRQIAVFSGIDFTVDASMGLSGICDFLISHSPELMVLRSPIAILVEAKKENLNAGLGQCLAEMFAALLFNERHGNAHTTILGVVTSGTNWRFMTLTHRAIDLDLNEYYLSDVGKILGILRSAVPSF
ncbi:MAG TPA: hypothetical protein DCQ32_04225 [Cyanobacteria bacterium UBA8156]|nr:hypothetical protein [Cyanobacteria bacterium UBA8156]